MLFIVFVMMMLSGATCLMAPSGPQLPVDTSDAPAVRFLFLMPSLPEQSPSLFDVGQVYLELESAVDKAIEGMGRNPRLGEYARYVEALENKNMEVHQTIRDAIAREDADPRALKERIGDIWSDFASVRKQFNLFDTNVFWQDLLDGVSWPLSPEDRRVLEEGLALSEKVAASRRDAYGQEIATQKDREGLRVAQVPPEDRAFLENMVSVYAGVAGYLKSILDDNAERDEGILAPVDMTSVLQNPAYRLLQDRYRTIVEDITSGKFSDTLARGEYDYDWGIEPHTFSYEDALEDAQRAIAQRTQGPADA